MRLETCPQFFIDVDLIKEAKHFKYLGIFIDTWPECNAQIKYLESKLSQLCGLSF